MSGERFESPRHESEDRLVGKLICLAMIGLPMGLAALVAHVFG